MAGRVRDSEAVFMGNEVYIVGGLFVYIVLVFAWQLLSERKYDSGKKGLKKSAKAVCEPKEQAVYYLL